MIGFTTFLTGMWIVLVKLDVRNMRAIQYKSSPHRSHEPGDGLSDDLLDIFTHLITFFKRDRVLSDFPHNSNFLFSFYLYFCCIQL